MVATPLVVGWSQRSRRRGHATDSQLPRWVFYAVGSLIALLFASPLLWVLINSLKSPTELAQSPPTYLPHQVTGESYHQLAAIGIWPYIRNSLTVTLGADIAVVVISTLAGYGFARFRFAGKAALFLVLLSTLMIPFQSIITPLYLILRNLGLTNSLLGLVLIYTTFFLPFSVFVMRNSFAAVPDALEEAAMLDGCGTLATLTRVMLPLALPGVVTVALYGFFSAWNEFFAALIFLNTEDEYTLPILLTNVETGLYGNINWGILETGVVVTMLPCIAVFLLLQRYYLTGMTAGATKG
jgi:multiple sugar transport system permease protein